MAAEFTLHSIPTDDPKAVEEAIAEIGQACFPDQKLDRIRKLMGAVDDLYQGKVHPYQASDMAYHDFEHTLQVTLCWARMFQSLKAHKPEYPVVYADFLLGIAACLLHDTGYLKETDDPSGTGAKYVLIHEHRSCQISRRFLMRLEWPDTAISVVQRMIASTGPRAVIDGIPFISPTEKAMAQMLATADFLAQMSDPAYLDKLPSLFEEFEEFDRLRGLSNTERPFPNLDTLVSSTPQFWYQFVLPRLKIDYNGVYRLLSNPYPEGCNAYLQQAEANIDALQPNAGDPGDTEEK
jgi:HD superfamily phosphodiesterase